MAFIQQDKCEYLLSISFNYFNFGTMQRIALGAGIHFGLDGTIPQFRQIYPLLSSDNPHTPRYFNDATAIYRFKGNVAGCPFN
jgi:hypothetical protein